MLLILVRIYISLILIARITVTSVYVVKDVLLLWSFRKCSNWSYSIFLI